jgi:hypothetical protein
MIMGAPAAAVPATRISSHAISPNAPAATVSMNAPGPVAPTAVDSVMHVAAPPKNRSMVPLFGGIAGVAVAAAVVVAFLKGGKPPVDTFGKTNAAPVQQSAPAPGVVKDSVAQTPSQQPPTPASTTPSSPNSTVANVSQSLTRIEKDAAATDVASADRALKGIDDLWRQLKPGSEQARGYYARYQAWLTKNNKSSACQFLDSAVAVSPTQDAKDKYKSRGEGFCS